MTSPVIEKKLYRLGQSKFRSRFKLSAKDRKYIQDKGMDTIEQHARDFVMKRLTDHNPLDGKQTPMRGHPVFVAQHATATCCRGCIARWHHIAPDKPLSPKDIDYLVTLIMEWIKRN